MSIFILKFIQETIGFIHKSFVFIHEGYTCILESFAYNVCETHLFAKVARLFKKQIYLQKWAQLAFVHGHDLISKGKKMLIYNNFSFAQKQNIH